MSAAAPYRDPQRDADARLKDLLGRMTLEEKLAQLGGVWPSDLVGEDGFDEPRALEVLANGIGHVTRIGVSTGLEPEARARFANRIQRVLVEHTRLGIPAIIHEEALAGLCARGATRFPQAIALAATWRPEAVRVMAEIIRRQMRAVGAHQALAPVLDIGRDPRWGRLEETFGEDPYLTGRLGVAFVRGLQGADLTDGVLATGRHFVGHGLPEGGMNRAPVQVGPRELRETFVEPFAAAIREANLRAVMVSPSSVDGVAPAASPELIDTLLRGELGFDGLVLCDDFGVEELVRHHRVARDAGSAAVLALAAGVDVELPVANCFGEPLRALIESGKVEEALLDRAVRRVLRTKLELGLFENPYVDEEAAARPFDDPQARAHARELAEQSLVLVKNDGVLPLAAGSRVALIGPAADDPRPLLGDHHHPVHAEQLYRHEELDSGVVSAAGKRPTAAEFRPGPFFGEIATLRETLSRRFDVLYERGCEILGAETGGIPAAVEAARAADVAVLCVGGRSGLMPDCTSGEFRDATDLGLTGVQRQLVAAVADTGTPVVLVVVGGRAFALEAEVAQSRAVVWAWLPGEEGAEALARVLSGEANPAGRLPVSLARTVGQVPVYYNHRAGGGRSMVLGDYTDGSSRPLFPFGHGLSYTQFEYEELSCPDTVELHAGINLWVTVRNVGDRAGDEVVQVYLRDKVADAARPVQQLAGFKRVTIPAGQARRLKFLLDATQLGYYDRGMRFGVDPGEVEVLVGSSSRSIHLRKTVVLKGERRPLQQKQVVATQVEVVTEEQR